MNAHESARRRLLGRAAAALPAMLVVPLFARPSTARAGNASKEDLHYQPPQRKPALRGLCAIHCTGK